MVTLENKSFTGKLGTPAKRVTLAELPPPRKIDFSRTKISLKHREHSCVYLRIGIR
jgi:hypothetical protein